jgi:hypothetical protein
VSHRARGRSASARKRVGHAYADSAGRKEGAEPRFARAGAPGDVDQAPATASGTGAAPRSASEAASACSISVGKLPNSATTTNGKNHTM